MINTKLILVDGITGSGKSTTSHYILRQLEKNGIKAKWHPEVENDHPFHVRIEGGDKITEAEWLDRFFDIYPKKLAKFAKEAEKDDTVHIVECFIFQDVLAGPLMCDCERSRIDRFYVQYMKIMKKLNPAVVHFYQKDVREAIRLNFERRGDDWKSSIISRDEKGLFYKNRNLTGEEGFTKYFEEMSDYALKLFDGLDCAKIKIENSSQDWPEYRKRITEFLKIKQHREKLYDSGFKKYCGEYLGNGYMYKVYEKNRCHDLDSFWPSIRIIQVSRNEYAIEGHPGSWKFYTYGGKRKFKFTQDHYHIKAGAVVEEYKRYAITEADLQTYCGDYRCEAENLDRKIFLDKGELNYYWCEKKAQCRLLPIGKNKFTKLGGMINTITFKKVKGTWHFKVWDKGYKSDAVFVKKEESK